MRFFTDGEIIQEKDRIQREKDRQEQFILNQYTVAQEIVRQLQKSLDLFKQVAKDYPELARSFGVAPQKYFFRRKMFSVKEIELYDFGWGQVRGSCGIYITTRGELYRYYFDGNVDKNRPDIYEPVTITTKDITENCHYSDGKFTACTNAFFPSLPRLLIMYTYRSGMGFEEMHCNSQSFILPNSEIFSEKEQIELFKNFLMHAVLKKREELK